MKADGISGDVLLQNSSYFKFRSFVHLLTEFGRLNDFLLTMDASSRTQLLQRFVRGLEKEKDPLHEATIVAEALNATKEEALLKDLQVVVKEEFERVQQENHKEGKAIYGILSGMFGDRVVIDQDWFHSMAQKFGLPRLDQLSAKRLFNEQGNDIQRYFFYDDEDGKSSFANFLATYKSDSAWKITFEPNYVHITAGRGDKKVEIFANLPEKRAEGQEDISKALTTRKEFAQVVVHRGHSYHARETISELEPNAVLVSLGSCGGFLLVSNVIDRVPQAVVLSTQGTGTMYVNDPLLKMLNDQILSAQDINWAEFWSKAEQQIGSPDFHDYVAPHKNFGLMFLRAYHHIVDTPVAVISSSSPLEPHNASTTPSNVGGINLDPKWLHLQIIRDGNGVPLPVLQQPTENMKIEGFSPVIINVVPVSIPLLLSDKPDQQPEKT